MTTKKDIFERYLNEYLKAKKNQKLTPTKQTSKTNKNKKFGSSTSKNYGGATSVKLGKLEGGKFVLTGAMKEMGRDEAKEKIRALGGSVSPSVSKNVDCIVAGKKAGGGKSDKAEKLGVKVLIEKEFLKLIK